MLIDEINKIKEIVKSKYFTNEMFDWAYNEAKKHLFDNGKIENEPTRSSLICLIINRIINDVNKFYNDNKYFKNFNLTKEQSENILNCSNKADNFQSDNAGLMVGAGAGLLVGGIIGAIVGGIIGSKLMYSTYNKRELNKFFDILQECTNSLFDYWYNNNKPYEEQLFAELKKKQQEKRLLDFKVRHNLSEQDIIQFIVLAKNNDINIFNITTLKELDEIYFKLTSSKEIQNELKFKTIISDFKNVLIDFLNCSNNLCHPDDSYSLNIFSIFELYRLVGKMNNLIDSVKETNQYNNLSKIYYACRQFVALVNECFCNSGNLNSDDYLFIFKPRLMGLTHLLKVVEHIAKNDNSFKVVVLEHKYQSRKNYYFIYNDIENNGNIVHLLFGLYSCIVLPVFNNELIINVSELPHKKGMRLKEIVINSLDEYINYFDIDDFLEVEIEKINSPSTANFNNDDNYNYQDLPHQDAQFSNRRECENLNLNDSFSPDLMNLTDEDEYINDCLDYDCLEDNQDDDWYYNQDEPHYDAQISNRRKYENSMRNDFCLPRLMMLTDEDEYINVCPDYGYLEDYNKDDDWYN